MGTDGFDEKNLAKHKERCDMIEQLAIAEEENRKLGIRADKLEQRLESETRKAERRMRHIDLMGVALTERRNQLHERGELIAELEKQVADLRAELANAEVPSEREREILDMWPKFEDGEPVMIGDEVNCLGGEIVEVYITENEVAIWNSCANHMHLRPGERVKHLAPKVIDADGVEIKVGDTVWHRSGSSHGVVTSIDEDSLMGTVRYVNGNMEFVDVARYLSHTRPDSWERLEDDAAREPCDYFGVECDEDKGCSGCPHLHKGRDCTIDMQADLVRRAKALAGVEVDA